MPTATTISIDRERSPRFEAMQTLVDALQDKICHELEARDGGSFGRDRWRRSGGGGGLSRVLQGDGMIEKGGVSVSSVWGELPVAAAARLGIADGGPFAACGLSLVIHPHSPRIPAAHMNIRYFEMDGSAWYGGGIDLTPFYPHTVDFHHFHTTLEDACESVGAGSYARHKAACDEYFSLPHRHEMRGIGGIFFDHQTDLDEAWRLVQSVGVAFLPSFLPIVDRRRDEPYPDDDRAFQLCRRGRYVEFNLLYDRGTRFGLQTDARIESVLMSLPPNVQFPYDYQPPSGSAAEVMTGYYQPLDWTDRSWSGD